MPVVRRLTLSPEARETLGWLRNCGPKAYLRERAAALLKVADGLSAERVAARHLLRPRRPDTVRAWLDRWQAEGLAGLYIRRGRGRKPAFSPPVRRRRGRARRAARRGGP